MIAHQLSASDPFRLTENAVLGAIFGPLPGARAVGMTEVGEFLIAA